MSAVLPSVERVGLRPDGGSLVIDDLDVTLTRNGERFNAVEGLSLTVERGRTTALVGESGSGKSVTALAVMRLLPPIGASFSARTLRLGDTDLAALTEREMQKIRGNRISMVFQEPMTSLNPVLTIGEQIVEVLRAHQPLGHAQAWAKAIELCRRVRIPDAERKVADYPHRLSGGMRQRVVIAIALACEPDILIADEPTTALDTTIQAQVLRLLRDLQREHDTGILLITHNLGVVAQAADRVVVMYAGRTVEEADVRDLFKRPLHPYTQGLLRAMPVPGRSGRLQEIPGTVPDPRHRPSGCAFHDRCPRAIAQCRLERPEMVELAPRHAVACFVAQKEAA
ncbi:MAG: Oligopeptide/dipeptide transporter, ATP-binding protein-like [Rhizobacter sp.]|nr:Oligopeptide/dipeptide transporter, ATP-binding protein-like [Rhizobacter sp.]